MFVRRCIVLGLSLIVVLVDILAACAAPTPTSTSTPTPTLTPTSTPTGALAQIIEGAKKEGSVSAWLKSTLTPKSMERLEREIKERFGVDLKIQFSPTTSFARQLSESIMEHKAGATPTYDVVNTSDTFIAQGIEAGAYERVDWKPLLPEDVNPEGVSEHPLLRGAIIYYTGHIGMMVNPDKVRADELPKALIDLADPKWTGRIGLLHTATTYARRAFILGKDKVFADLRAVVKNKALIGLYQEQYNRYLLGEIWMAFMTSSYLKEAWDKDVPAVFQSIDFAELANYSLILRTGAAHPNAAKLVAIYLASPAGAKFMLEEGQAGNANYSGNFEHDLRLQVESQGFPIYSRESYPGLLEFHFTDQYSQWEKEADLILKGG